MGKVWWQLFGGKLRAGKFLAENFPGEILVEIVQWENFDGKI